MRFYFRLWDRYSQPNYWFICVNGNADTNWMRRNAPLAIRLWRFANRCTGHSAGNP